MKRKTELVFHEGLNTIGSNIVSIRLGNYRIITDFGAISGVTQEELSSEEDVVKLLRNKKLPRIDGIYKAEALHEIPHQSFENSDYQTIVLISHMHLDHIGSFYHLHPEIPVYATKQAASLYRLFADQELLPEYQINLIGIDPEETLVHGPFNIQFYLNDHDTLGAASIFIETSDLRVIYSGDLRLSGFHPAQVLNWLQAAQLFKPDILLLEGTSFSFTEADVTPLDLELNELLEDLKLTSERGLINKIDTLLAEKCNSLFAFNGYPQNIDRWLELVKAAEKHQRILVLQPKMFAVLSEINKSLNSMASIDEVTLNDIKSAPHKFIIQIDEFTYDLLSELPSGYLLHSNGVPLGSYMPLYEHYVKSIMNQGWHILNAGVSGHASQTDLLTIAYIIKAEITVPWHTRYPVNFAGALHQHGLKAFLPEADQVYTIKNIKASMKAGK